MRRISVRVLQASNGEIVSQKALGTFSGCPKANKCYKIKYLSDGLEVVGYIVTPKDTSIKRPVMIVNRGGNREFAKLTNKSLKYLTYLSSNGYIVLASQYRGNDGGQGKEQFGGDDVNDVLNLLPLANSLPFADENNAVMLGFSRGGMMTLLAIKNGADIKAAATVGSVSDLEQWYNERDEKLKKVIRELVGTDKKEWKKRSAVYWPEKISVPVLILHGSDDWRVNVSHSKNLSYKLTEAGKEHRLVIIQNGDHSLSKHKKERNELILEWFSRYIH